MESSAMQPMLHQGEKPFPEATYATFIQDSPSHVTDFTAARARIESLEYSLGKRSIDIGLTSILALAMTPLFLAIAIAIRLTSAGPVLYCERRIGRYGAPFTIYKFRSMYTKEQFARLGMKMSAEEAAQKRTFTKCHHDPRITPVGSLIRRWSLDELPQLWNVLQGAMSLVGPRPVVRAERDLYGKYGRYYDLAIPGISGLWQVSGRSNITFPERISLDCKYALQWGLLLDFIIMLKTFSAVLQKRGAY